MKEAKKTYCPSCACACEHHFAPAKRRFSAGKRGLPKLALAGFSVMTAIFLLVVLALLAAALINLNIAQQQQSALDVMGARAYQAARSGIEWGLYQHLRLGAACNGATNSFPLPAGNSLSGFKVSVRCVQTPPGAITATTRRQLTAVACNQANLSGVCPNPNQSPDYVQRRVQVEF